MSSCLTRQTGEGAYAVTDDDGDKSTVYFCKKKTTHHDMQGYWKQMTMQN